jgi:hypothetical protein
MVQPDPGYLTIEEIAERYRTSVATARYWRHVGYGPKGVLVGRRVLYPQREVDRFDRELAEQAAAAATA